MKRQSSNWGTNKIWQKRYIIIEVKEEDTTLLNDSEYMLDDQKEQ